jgi:hypothetical protein
MAHFRCGKRPNDIPTTLRYRKAVHRLFCWGQSASSRVVAQGSQFQPLLFRQRARPDRKRTVIIDLAAHNADDVSPVTYVGNRSNMFLEPHAKLTGLFIMRYSLHMIQFLPLAILHSSSLITIHTSGQVASTAPVLARVTGYHLLGITIVATCTRHCICVKKLAISAKAAQRSDSQCLSSSLVERRIFRN